MDNHISVFKSFYGKYDYNAIKKAYNNIYGQLYIWNIHKPIIYDAEIRINKDILAMQVKSERDIPMELLTLIGFFFEKYSSEKNCVWTKKKENIKQFFYEGISKFIDCGAKIKLSLSAESIRMLVAVLTEHNKADEKLFEMLCVNFSRLEQTDWKDYRLYIENLLQREENDKHIETVTNMNLPVNWKNVFADDENVASIHAESIEDGLVISLNNLGRVDIEYISQITGASYKTVISALRGTIYQNPDSWEECFYKGWETADEYLSGRVLYKLNVARKENEKYKGYFEQNIKALEKFMPQTIPISEIYITLGSPWVPPDIIEDFIENLFDPYKRTHVIKNRKNQSSVLYDETTGTWEITTKTRYKGSIKSNSTYGTSRIEAINILERTLNMQSIYVTDEIETATLKSGKKRVINRTETLLALEKQKAIIQKFQEWVWQDYRRKERLVKIYEEKYGSRIGRNFDGSFLELPNMSPLVSLYDYQKNAIARILFSPNTLLAHEVGSGKTYVMVVAGMELKRIGVSQKNLYVVPNNIIGQWENIFLELYPDAKLLCIDPKNFTKDKRQKVLKTIRDEEFDAIIMTYSCFDMIPISKSNYKIEIQKQIENISEIAKRKNKICPALARKREKLLAELAEFESLTDSASDEIYFDDLSINTLFVDEAHNYKNVPIETKVSGVLGVSKTGSAKCQRMMNKVRIVQRNNNGRGVVMATGTPITNSITDIYIMQKYLQNDELENIGLQNFDSWIGMFAEKISEVEVDVDTKNFRIATRFSKFHNIVELSALLSEIADFHQVDKTNGIPKFNGYKDVLIKKNDGFDRYLNVISVRADDVRNGRVEKCDDNMLKITTDGRKAALDLRLVDSNASFTYQSKVFNCAKNVFDIYVKTAAQQSTQLIFCDTSIPKTEFNLYDELKSLLIKDGIPRNEIAYIHDAETEQKRKILFSKVRKGEIRILIGSTFKLGLGVNVQDRLIAIHHLDVPWRPADMVQREGRILRKGNRNKSVDIYRYITEGSFDAYSWQLLEAKQKMIIAILSGCIAVRTCADIEGSVLNYAEIKALAIGNQDIKRRFEIVNELSKYLIIQKQLAENRQILKKELLELPSKVAYQKQLIDECRKDVEFYTQHRKKYDCKERKTLRQQIYAGVFTDDFLIEECELCNYQGFKIIRPVNMIKKKPYLYIQKNGRYHVELGFAETGILVRIDHFLDDLSNCLKILENRLKDLYIKEADIKTELSRKEDYSDAIETLKTELKAIDNKLGVQI